MAKVALYLAIIALGISVIPYVGILAVFPGVFAFFMGLIEYINKYHMYDDKVKKRALFAMLLSFLALLMSVVWMVYARA